MNDKTRRSFWPFSGSNKPAKIPDEAPEKTHISRRDILRGGAAMASLQTAPTSAQIPDIVRDGLPPEVSKITREFFEPLEWALYFKKKIEPHLDGPYDLAGLVNLNDALKEHAKPLLHMGKHFAVNGRLKAHHCTLDPKTLQQLWIISEKLVDIEGILGEFLEEHKDIKDDLLFAPMKDIYNSISALNERIYDLFGCPDHISFMEDLNKAGFDSDEGTALMDEMLNHPTDALAALRKEYLEPVWRYVARCQRKLLDKKRLSQDDRDALVASLREIQKLSRDSGHDYIGDWMQNVPNEYHAKLATFTNDPVLFNRLSGAIDRDLSNEPHRLKNAMYDIERDEWAERTAKTDEHKGQGIS